MINILKQPKLFAAGMLLPCSMGAFAGGSLALEEVVVTAQKREQTLQDIPGSVAVLDEARLQQSATTEFSDLSSLTPGLNLAAASDGFAPLIRIRGVGNNRLTPSIRPSVGIFIDDIPLTRPEAAFNNLTDIRSIEVLKGPQSTLFGKGVSSGAINIHTKNPDMLERSGFAETSIADSGLREYRGGLNIPLTDKLAARGSVYQTTKSEQLTNLFNGEDDETNTQGGRLRVLWEPVDELSVRLGYDKHDLQTTNSGVDALVYGGLTLDKAAEKGLLLPDANPFDGKNYQELATDRDSDSEIFSLAVHWDIDDNWSFDSISAQQKWQAVVDEPAGGTSPFGIVTAIPSQDIDTFSQEFRFLYDRDKLSSMMGIFYADSDRAAHIQVLNTALVIPGDDLALAILVEQDERSRDYGLFMHNIYAFTDATDITFGLRYNKTQTEGVNYQYTGAGYFVDQHSPLVGTPSSWAIPARRDSWKKVTGTLKVNHFVTEDISVYAGLGTGFKAGGFDAVKNAALYNGSETAPLSSFEAETATSWEIGVKGNSRDSSLRWAASAFYQLYDDYQVEVPDPVGPGNDVNNAGEVVSQGFEAEVTWLLSEQLLIDGSLSYIDSRWGEYGNAPCHGLQIQAATCVDGVQDLSGKRRNGTSPWTANLGASWTDSYSDELDWFARLDLVFRDDFIGATDLDPRTKQSSYTLVNATAGLMASGDGGWEIKLWAKNLTDEKYIALFSNARDGYQPNGTWGWGVNSGARRTLGATLGYTF